MKKFKTLFLCFVVICSLSYVPRAQAAMDAKGKAFMIMCAYGTVGGALLGFASMAYGTNSRAIAQGASLGLYAGIIFGSYIILSHRPPGQVSPAEYESQQPYGGAEQAPPPPGLDPWSSGGGSNSDPQSNGGGFFDAPHRIEELQIKNTYQFKGSPKPSIPVYINLLNYSF